MAVVGLLKVLIVLVGVAFGYASLSPAYVHLFVTGDATSLQVTFITNSLPTTPGVTYWVSSPSSKPTTIIAPAKNIYNFTRPGTTSVDYISSLTMTSLTQATTYSYYVFGDAKDNTTISETFTFHTMPADDDTLNIGLYGDMGSEGEAIMSTGNGGLLYYAKNRLFDLVVHNGDLAYNLDGSNGVNGADFMAAVEPLTSTVPYMVTPGNHEFFGNSEAYYTNWFLYGQGPVGQNSGSSNPMWYSFDVGTKLHVIAISTEAYCEDTGNVVAQHKWLESDLAAVRARSVQPWVIVFGHRQMYVLQGSPYHARLMRLGVQCSSPDLSSCNFSKVCTSGVNCGYSIEKLFAEYKVDLYFAGHIHMYARNYPISSNHTYELQDNSTYINPQHTVYVVSGAAGTQHGQDAAEEGNIFAPTVAFTLSGYTFSYLKIYNNSYLTLDQIDVQSGSSVDTFAIVRDSSLPPWVKTDSFYLLEPALPKCDQ